MSERAKCKVFEAVDFVRTVPVKSFWACEDKEFFDKDAYYEAVRDFLTLLGPARIISLQRCWSHGFKLGFTEVWYWETE